MSKFEGPDCLDRPTTMTSTADLDRILTTKGYGIRKSSLSEAQTKELLEALTVCPKLNTKFATKAATEQATFKVYKQSPVRWYVPRAWGLAAYGPPQTSLLPEGLPLPEAAKIFQGSPYDYQEGIMQSFHDAGAKGLLCVPCGKGKTFMAVRIAATLGVRFLVIVDKEFLMNQWRNEMKQLLPNLRVGIFQGPKQEIEPELYDCTICMIQTLCNTNCPDATFHGYGFTIFDECHHLGAQHFSRTLLKVQTKWMLGLSATPTREDGLTKVFTWFLGNPVYWEKVREPDPTVEVKGVFVKTDNAAYHKLPVDWKGEVVMARLLGNLVDCEERTAEVVRWVRRLLAESPVRKVLVLSERIGHLQAIECGLGAPDGTAVPSIAYYVGGMKEKIREEGAAAASVLLASYAMASEAMNIKTLNAVILASPRKHVEQSTGRILRIQADKRVVVPVIVDIVDEHSMYRSQWEKRLAYYRQCAYTVERWAMGAESGTPLVKKARGSAAAEKPQAGTCLLLDD